MQARKVVAARLFGYCVMQHHSALIRRRRRMRLCDARTTIYIGHSLRPDPGLTAILTAPEAGDAIELWHMKQFFTVAWRCLPLVHKHAMIIMISTFDDFTKALCPYQEPSDLCVMPSHA